MLAEADRGQPGVVNGDSGEAAADGCWVQPDLI